MTSKLKTRQWDPAEHLETEDHIATYLQAAFQEGDPSLVAAVLADIARARDVAQNTRESGLGSVLSCR